MTEDWRRHPLAHRSGLNAIEWFLAAYATWDHLTRAQRRVLLSGDVAGAHPRVQAGLRAAGCADGNGLIRWGQWVAHTRDETLYADLFAFSDDGELMWRAS